MDMTIRHAEDMSDAPRVELLTAMQSLYHSREYSDLILLAGDGSRYPVHRAIVCPRSKVLADAVKNRRWKDGTEGHVLLSEDDPEIVRLTVEYFYLLDYEPCASSDDESSRPDSSDTMSLRTDAGAYGQVYGTSAISAFGGPTAPPHSDLLGVTRSYTTSSLTSHALPTSDFNHFLDPTQRHYLRRPIPNDAPEPSPLATRDPHLVVHAKLYSAADRFGVRGLKTLALDKFKLQLTRHWDSPEFAEAIEVIYNTRAPSDKDMREAVVNALGWHSNLLDKPDIELTVKHINGLAYELLKRSRRAEPEYLR